MRVPRSIIAGLLLAACTSQPEPEAEALNLHETMKEIDADAVRLWEISNAAIDDVGGIDASAMSDADWTALAKAAENLSGDATRLAQADAILVAAAGVKIDGVGEPGASSAADVQGFVDADPANLKEMAQALAVHAADLQKAAEAQDAERAGPLVAQLDAVCESCHVRFWYPQYELPPGYPHPDEILGKR